jgi:tetratricopeptide (TPR) repeat protein
MEANMYEDQLIAEPENNQQNEINMQQNMQTNFDIVNFHIVNNDFAAAEQHLILWDSQEPNNPFVYTFCAHICRKMNNIDKALEYCNKSLSLDVNNYSAQVEKARILAQQGNHILACHLYIKIYESYPTIGEYLTEWCESLSNIQDYRTLAQVAMLAIAVDPDNSDLYFHAGLGMQYEGRHKDAITFYEKCYALAPNTPMILNNLGAAHKENGNVEKAKQLMELELKNNPQNHCAWTNYGSILQKMHMLEESKHAHLNAIKLQPQYALSYNNLALTLREMQDFKAAEQALESSCKLDPNYTSAKWNLAMSKLLAGNYKEGWPLHEYRWTGSGELRDHPHGIAQPEWDGKTSLKGKRLFLWGEQGFGDALQFCRYIPLLAKKVNEMGGKISYCCFTLLQDLFKSSFGHVVDGDIIDDKTRPLPDFDFHLPLLKLPLIFDTTVDSIPQTTPYIKPSTKATLKAQKLLEQDKKLKVGLIWTGSHVHQRNPYRSVWIENYLRFVDIKNTSFYGLQFNADQDIAKAKEHGLDIIDITKHINNFDESAAIINELDLVITTCTSTAHLAGALGVPTWIMLDVNPHWVWLTERTDSPWYPKSKLYRQTEYRNWETPMNKVHADLKAWSNAQPIKISDNTNKQTITKSNKGKASSGKK